MSKDSKEQKIGLMVEKSVQVLSKITLEDEKEKLLFSLKKESLYEKINDIGEKLKKEDNLFNFIIREKLISKVLKSQTISYKNKIILFIQIKIFGTLFMIFHYLSIFILIGFMNALKDELYNSLKFVLFEKEIELDFYENYNKTYFQIPEISFFYLSSFFSGYLLNLLGFFWCNFIILLLNVLDIYIGTKSIDFHTREDLNTRYSLNKFLFIFFNFLLIYLGTGIIISYPDEFLIKCYSLYDENKKENYSKKDDDVTKQKSSNYGYNGYIFSYIFSIISSSILTLILNNYLVINKSRGIFYRNIILIYIISTILSLFCYLLLPSIKEEDKSEKELVSFHFCGYVFYSEKFKYNNKKEHICIVYKTKGICSWFFHLICNVMYIGLVSIIIFLEINNIGFKSSMSEFCDNYKTNEHKKFTIYIISYSSLTMFYILNIILGYLTHKIFFSNTKEGESNILLNGMLFVLFIANIYSTIISILFYYNILSNNIQYYSIISIQSSEYMKTVILLIFDLIPMTYDELGFELISPNAIISIYLLCYDVISFVIGLFNIKLKILILIQYIFGIILFVFLLIGTFCCGGCSLLYKENNNERKINTIDYEKNSEEYTSNSNQIILNDID